MSVHNKNDCEGQVYENYDKSHKDLQLDNCLPFGFSEPVSPENSQTHGDECDDEYLTHEKQGCDYEDLAYRAHGYNYEDLMSTIGYDHENSMFANEPTPYDNTQTSKNRSGWGNLDYENLCLDTCLLSRFLDKYTPHGCNQGDLPYTEDSHKGLIYDEQDHENLMYEYHDHGHWNSQRGDCIPFRF